MFKAFGEGRLVADPELKEVGTTVVVNLRVAVNEFRKHGTESIKEAHYFDLKAWDSGARTIAEYAKKGDMLVFEARPRQESWEDKATGQKKSRTVFRVENFHIHHKKDDSCNDEVVSQT